MIVDSSWSSTVLYPVKLSPFSIALYKTGWWFPPLWKNESQLGRFFPMYGKMFQTTNQYIVRLVQSIVYGRSNMMKLRLDSWTWTWKNKTSSKPPTSIHGGFHKWVPQNHPFQWHFLLSSSHCGVSPWLGKSHLKWITTITITLQGGSSLPNKTGKASWESWATPARGMNHAVAAIASYS